MSEMLRVEPHTFVAIYMKGDSLAREYLSPTTNRWIQPTLSEAQFETRIQQSRPPNSPIPYRVTLPSQSTNS